jgi:hypothetical protein
MYGRIYQYFAAAPGYFYLGRGGNPGSAWPHRSIGEFQQS